MKKPIPRTAALLGFVLTLLVWANPLPALAEPSPPQTDPPAQTTFWDDQKYIDIDQIQPGMKGYGLTVFHGTKIEPFDIVVVSVMRNYEPSRDAFLIRCQDKRFDLAKGVQGVSGSPVYLNGKLAGAMAFGWTFGEEPLYGVTPIRQMLQVRHTSESPSNSGSKKNAFQFPAQTYRDLLRPELLSLAQLRELACAAGLTQPENSNPNQSNNLTMLMPAVTAAGLGPESLRQFQQWFPQSNILQAPAGQTHLQNQSEPVDMKPGGVLTIPLIWGDMSIAVLGTITEVAGDRVYGFGHAWLGQGDSQWPMASGYVHTFVNSKYMSFKLGQASDIVGAIYSDQATAVFGKIGQTVPTVEAQIQVHWPDQTNQTFRMKMAQDERLDPILAGFAANSVLLQKGGLPRDHTIRYHVHMDFQNALPIDYENITADNNLEELLMDDLLPTLALLLNNPWQDVQLQKLNIKADIIDHSQTAEILSARLSSQWFYPGQTVNAQLQIQPFRTPAFSQSISLPLPDDLPEGTYEIQLAGRREYQSQMQESQTHRFIAYDEKDVQRILQERLSIPRNRLYMIMPLKEGGLALKQQEWPDLPPTKAMLLTQSLPEQIKNPYRRLLIQSQPLDDVLQGKIAFEIEVRKKPDR